MSALKCPNCDSVLREGAKFCPNCGTRLTSDEAKIQTVKKSGFPKWLMILLPIIIIIVVGLAFGTAKYKPEKSASLRSPRLAVEINLVTRNQGFFSQPINLIEATVRNLSQDNIVIDTSETSWESAKSDEKIVEKGSGIEKFLQGLSGKSKEKGQENPEKNLNLSYKITAQIHKKAENAWEDISADSIVCKAVNRPYAEQALGPNGQLEYVIGQYYLFSNMFRGSDQLRVTVFNDTGKDRVEKIIDLPEGFR